MAAMQQLVYVVFPETSLTLHNLNFFFLPTQDPEITNHITPSAVTQQLCSNACLYQKINAWCQSRPAPPDCLELGHERPNKILQ